MAFDPRGDFELLTDGLETVTYEPPVQDGSAWPVEVPKALKRAMNRAEIEASNGLALMGDQRWHFSCLLFTDEPSIGGVVVQADGTRWTIITVARETMGSRWAMATRNLAIFYDLNTVATIERATYAKADGGAVEPDDWQPVARIRARVQPQQTTVRIDADQPIAETTHRIILEREFALDAGAEIGRDYRVTTCQAGVTRIFKLTGYERSETVGALPVLLAIETPRPME